jgi:hypothetical protein
MKIPTQDEIEAALAVLAEIDAAERDGEGPIALTTVCMQSRLADAITGLSSMAFHAAIENGVELGPELATIITAAVVAGLRAGIMIGEARAPRPLDHTGD